MNTFCCPWLWKWYKIQSYFRIIKIYALWLESIHVSMNWSCYILCTSINVVFNILVSDNTNMGTLVNDIVTGDIDSNVLYLDQCIQCYVLIYLHVCHPDVSNNKQHWLAQYISQIFITVHNMHHVLHYHSMYQLLHVIGPAHLMHMRCNHTTRLLWPHPVRDYIHYKKKDDTTMGA